MVGGFQILEQRRQGRGVAGDVHLLRVGGEDRVHLAPQLGPVHLLLGLLAGVPDDTLDFLHLGVVLEQVVQGGVVKLGQAFGLADVRQRFVQLPLGDGLAANPQLLRHLLLGEALAFPGIVQAISQTAHGVSSFGVLKTV